MKTYRALLLLFLIGGCNQTSFQGAKKNDEGKKEKSDAETRQLENSGDETAAAPGNITGASLACVFTKEPDAASQSAQVGCRLSNNQSYAKEDGYQWSYKLADTKGVTIKVTETPSDPKYNAYYDYSGAAPAVLATIATMMEVVAQKSGASSYEVPVKEVQKTPADIDAIITKENEVKNNSTTTGSQPPPPT